MNRRVEAQKLEEDEVIPRRISFPNNPPSYVPRLPYPQRLAKANLDEKFGKILEAFKKFHINIPFTYVLS